MINDTICSIATSLSSGGISIIRISGDDALKVVNRIFFTKTHKCILQNPESHKIYYGFIFDTDKIVDEVLVSFFKAPKSYTCEDVIEINCHGGSLVTNRILRLVCKAGARPAEPGEFTKRAFLNGRIDLTEAEAIMDIISSENELSLNNSIDQLNGFLKKKISNIRKKIIYEIAFIESALDDPEHISLDGYCEKLSDTINSILIEINNLILSYDDGKIIKNGINTVIIGRPNAGKSSLINNLTGKEVAIVTDIEGTTRDVIEQNINIKGIALNIFDTAGIRETDDLIEKIGVERSFEAAEKSDLILYVVDGSSFLNDNDYRIIDYINKSDKNIIIVLNKSDLSMNTNKSDIYNMITNKEIPFISISAVNGYGILELKSIIEQLFLSNNLNDNSDIFVTNERHYHLLDNSKKSLDNTLRSIEMNMPEDFLSIDLMDAYTNLGLIIGEEVGEDLVNEIFSKFCMGK